MEKFGSGIREKCSGSAALLMSLNYLHFWAGEASLQPEEDAEVWDTAGGRAATRDPGGRTRNWRPGRSGEQTRYLLHATLDAAATMFSFLDHHSKEKKQCCGTVGNHLLRLRFRSDFWQVTVPVPASYPDHKKQFKIFVVIKIFFFNVNRSSIVA